MKLLLQLLARDKLATAESRSPQPAPPTPFVTEVSSGMRAFFFPSKSPKIRARAESVCVFTNFPSTGVKCTSRKDCISPNVHHRRNFSTTIAAERLVSACGSRKLMSTASFSMCPRTHSEKLVAGGTISGTQASGKHALQLRPVIGPIVQRLNRGVVKLGAAETST